MRVDEAFDSLQRVIDADPAHVREARRRRDIFRGAFEGRADVESVIPSGSLARSTQLDPIHDVDLVIVFRATSHADWGSPGASADGALGYLRDLVQHLLGQRGGRERHYVNATILRNHVVRCYIEPRGRTDDSRIRDAFSVEVMPALRDDQALRVPRRDVHNWHLAQPEYLIALVRDKQEQWPRFVPLIRVIKYWARGLPVRVKSLAAEVLAVENLPSGSAAGVDTRASALSRFFTAAAANLMKGIDDPAGYCGEIQPDLEYERLQQRLYSASELAAHAVRAEQDGEHHRAICLWREAIGPGFPEPPGGCRGHKFRAKDSAPRLRGQAGEPGNDDAGASESTSPGAGGGDRGPGPAGPAAGGNGGSGGGSGGGSSGGTARDGSRASKAATGGASGAAGAGKPLPDAPQG